MRHRIVSSTGLGNPSKELLSNKGDLNQEFAQAALEELFQKEKGFDFEVGKSYVKIGLEPTYQFDPLKIIHIDKDKLQSYYETGVAFGPYGSDIVKRSKTYESYKRKTKLIRFIDKWHPILFGE